ncbi:hypothetical protein [Streptomyces sp. NPDC051665]|uniref:hypothetical protein n=1 Tax=Streptomyces sp. NPDC051665 TaxID=3154647 RepID=UPI003445D8F8
MTDLSMPATTGTTTVGEARELRRLLAVVLDAITLDYAAPDYERRLADRAGWAHTVLTAVNNGTSNDIGWEADFLRSKLTAEQADADAKAVRRSVDRAFPTVAAFLADEREAGK